MFQVRCTGHWFLEEEEEGWSTGPRENLDPSETKFVVRSQEMYFDVCGHGIRELRYDVFSSKKADPEESWPAGGNYQMNVQISWERLAGGEEKTPVITVMYL